MRRFSDEENVIDKENKLRTWFTQGLPDKDRIIDGFDIGWGGTARWATSILAEHLDSNKKLIILDVACGYGTFLVELGWRFPKAELIGLNLDFKPPHNIITSLLTQGGVKAHLMSADAVKLPLKSAKINCITCFLGLQDIIITRGEENLVKVGAELLRTVSPQGLMVLIDNISQESFKKILSLQKQEYHLVTHQSFKPNCKWPREIGLRAVEMYAQGYLQQELNSKNPPEDSNKAMMEIRKNMLKEFENQLELQDYYNPWSTIHLFLFQRL
ncbi:MAG: class I SAM-dependent methyltransferase [Promethearchaeota archaeon]